MLTPNQILDFLVDYRDLCEKHQVRISGCGCCGSPWIEELPSPIISASIQGLNDLTVVCEGEKDYAKADNPTHTIVPLSENLAKQLKPKEGTSSTD
jgi:hypothetical protein